MEKPFGKVCLLFIKYACKLDFENAVTTIKMEQFSSEPIGFPVPLTKLLKKI